MGGPSEEPEVPVNGVTLPAGGAPRFRSGPGLSTIPGTPVAVAVGCVWLGCALLGEEAKTPPAMRIKPNTAALREARSMDSVTPTMTAIL